MSQVMGMDISSANAEAVLVIESIFPAGVPLEMFSTDQSLSMGEVTVAETRMGVDGKLVAGYLPAIYPVSIMLEAPSPSNSILSTVWQAMSLNRRMYKCTLVCTVPSIHSVFMWSTGIMKSGSPFPDLKKTLAPVTWKFEFQDFVRTMI